MATLVKTKASIEQTLALATFLFNKGLTAQESLAWLKSKSYTVKGVEFQATSVAYAIAGIVIGVSLPKAPKSKAKKVKVEA